MTVLVTSGPFIDIVRIYGAHSVPCLDPSLILTTLSQPGNQNLAHGSIVESLGSLHVSRLHALQLGTTGCGHGIRTVIAERVHGRRRSRWKPRSIIHAQHRLLESSLIAVDTSIRNIESTALVRKREMNIKPTLHLNNAPLRPEPCLPSFADSSCSQSASGPEPKSGRTIDSHVQEGQCQ